MYCAITTLVPSMQLSLDAVALSVEPESNFKRECQVSRSASPDQFKPPYSLAGRPQL